MGGPRIVPFKAEHLVAIRLRDYGGSDLDCLAIGKMYEAGGPAFSGELDGQVLGSAGIVVLQKPFERIGEAWVWVPREVVRYPLFFHRSIKAMMAEVKWAKRLFRIQTTVQVLDIKANQWIKRLGFEAEGVMRRGGPVGVDVIRYAIVEPREAQEVPLRDPGQDIPRETQIAPPVAVNSFRGA